MTTEDYSTTHYGPEHRHRLGVAVRLAREAAGYKSRPKFLAHYGIDTPYGISKKSLELLERGQPGVGGPILRSVGRALPNWTAETPRLILEGGVVPPIEPAQAEPPMPPFQAAALVELDRLIAAGVPTDDAVDSVVAQTLAAARHRDRTARDAG